MANDLERRIREYASDLRNNRCGGDVYNFESMRSIADYLEILVERAKRVEVETERADDNGRSCKEFCKALKQIRLLTTQSHIREIADTALRMPWLTDGKDDKPIDTTEDMRDMREELWTHPIQKG